jgi:Concanavalin A-like lectin/glucanases superfamily/Immunoglobulin I-set domain/Immunoglobulin domain
MRINDRNWTNRFATSLAFVSVFLAIHARALDVIDPTGVNYTGVSDSSHYDGTYTAANLFDQNMTGVPLGTILSGNEYATAGQSSAFVAFQLDQAYTNVASIFYAQRNGFDPAQDKIGIISIWASSSTPFTAADPGTPPDSVVNITNSTGGQWTEYLMTNTVAGQYFLLKLQQASVGGNPGGSELRLGAVLGIPPAIVQAPADKTVYTNGTARFSASTTGTAPLVYSWVHGSSPLSNGGRISGADTGNLVISNVTLADAGNYSLTISNFAGAIGASANLAVVTAPTNAAETSVISKGPLAFWQLNEPISSTIALDLVGSFNGTYGSSSGVGANGPQSPAYPGFASTNTAVQTYAFTIDSAVTVPPMNISNTNSVTILAWIYQDGLQGPQQPYTGIVYCRGAAGQTSAGLICSGDGTQLAYQWGGNRYNFTSGLVIPTNQWTLVALVYTTNFTTLYCGSSNGIVLSALDNFAMPGQAFEAPMYIGLDPDVGESSRTFNGVIDDVAFFNRALSSSEINAIYAAGTGITPSLQIVGQTATNLNIFQGQPINLSVQVSGLSPAYQWYKQSAPIVGATNSTFTISSAKVSDSGNYYVIVSNQVNSVSSAVISVTVPNYMVLPVGPSGAIYSGIAASSQYPDPNYVGTNMFDSDLTGVPLGTHLTGKDWADDGYGTVFAPAYLAFQVDQSYPVNGILYAQRNDQSGQTIDKVTSISVWASQTTPFTAADPGTPPDAVVSIPDIDAGILHAYILPATVTGQYFVIEVDQDPIVFGSNIGGNEFRLGTVVTTVPLTFSNTPAGLILSWPGAATLQQSGSISGPWVTATGVTSGVPVPKTAAQQFYRILY